MSAGPSGQVPPADSSRERTVHAQGDHDHHDHPVHDHGERPPAGHDQAHAGHPAGGDDEDHAGHPAGSHDHTSAGHSHAGHGHGHHHHALGSGPAQQRALLIALVLTGGFAGVEALGGWWSGSLALLSDAGHMLSDALALGMAVLAARLARRPPSARHSYGLARAEVLAAAFNALLMLGVIVAITVESVQRLLHPAPVAGAAVMGIAAVGLLVNVVTAVVLARAGDGLNVRAALLHVLGDLLGSVAALLAGAVIWYTGWLPADPLLSLVVTLGILFSTLRLLGETTHVLMEGVPSDLDLAAVGRGMAGLRDVQRVHDLHIWTLASGQTALSAHIDIAELQCWPRVLKTLREHLRSAHGIDHVTLQPECPLAAPKGSRSHIPIHVAPKHEPLATARNP